MRTRLLTVVLTFAVMPLGAENVPSSSPEPNPLLAEWQTPFGVPPFDRLAEEHFLPAFEEGIARQRAEVAAIVASEVEPNFANTLEALERSGELLTAVASVFFNLTSAETTDGLQAIAKEVAPKLSAVRDDILLDEELFRRVRAVWDRRDELDLDPEQRRLLEETYKDFVRGGANLSPDAKRRLRAVNEELALLGLDFAENLRHATNEYRLVIERQEDLAGLPEGLIAAAAAAASAAELDGKWVFTLQAPSLWPFLQAAENRELRREILNAYIDRCRRGSKYDNSEILVKIVTLRAEKARLLGFATWADFVLEERMAKTPAAVYALLDQIWAPALRVAKQEAAALQAMIREDGHQFDLQPWDWRFYTEKVRQARYDLDEEALRPYFELERVREGAFWVAQQLYGITFTERDDIPTYHPEVRTFEVKDAQGAHLGVFLCDYHPRPGKRGGAWSGRYRSQHIKDGRNIRPIVVNVGNFSRPAGDQPALLSLEETQTLFHELGHGLHALLAQIRYESLARVPRDFTELPSQIMENWLWEPEVLAVYARHWKTGEVIPQELVAKIKATRTFNQGFANAEYLAASYLDMDWHTLSEPKAIDQVAFESDSLERVGLIPEIVVRYRSPYFSHVFGGGGSYSAGYYSYIWAEVLDADAFQAFKEHGIFDTATASSFRTNILERGGTEDAMTLFKRFRGREPRVEPLLERRGLLADGS